MAELGWTDYTLPSRGVLYEDRLPGGKVQVRQMSGKQQALLLTQGGGTIGKIDAIIDTCCKLPAGITHKELLLTDRFAILLMLRTKSFGPEYSFKWRCRCTAWQQATVNVVEEMNEKAGTPDLKEPIEITLSDCTVQARFLRGVDEETVMRNSKRMQMQSQDNQDPSYLHRLAMQLVSRDGEEFKNQIERLRFVENISASDLLALEDAVTEAETGIDTRLYLDCATCGTTNELGMPLTAEFFRPRSAGGRSRDDRDESVLPGVSRERLHAGRRERDDAGRAVRPRSTAAQAEKGREGRVRGSDAEG